jgi:hypothetical protein
LPGEAFCDECGAALSGVAPSGTAYDAPTIYAAPASGNTPAGTESGQGPICPACGHQNLPGDRFCDNCGAALEAQPPAPAPAVSEAPTAPADEELLRALHEAPPTPHTPPAPEAASPPPPQAAPARLPVSAADMPTAEQVGLPSAQADYEAKRKQLEDEIARQQQIVAQFEQMQATFGPAAPAAVAQGLAEARERLARAQADLDALQPPQPQIDPAVVARLNEEIERQARIIAQFEQMQATFGPAAPAAVAQGLAEAREAKARAEAELAALGGGAAPPAPPTPAGQPRPTVEQAAIPETPPQPTPAPAPMGAEAGPGEPGSVPAPAAAVPTAAPEAPKVAAPAPRLVLEDLGKELPLPTDKREIIIGREDPISGIFPEIDLTPYGGESGGVSRQHARLSREDGQWTITDLNSTNYTRVDGTRIDPSVPVPIKDGSRIQLGRVILTFRE